MNQQRFFITGTDTEVGKTYITCELIRHFISQDKVVVGIKPIAAGAVLEEGFWRNDDALELMAAHNMDLPYNVVNPICLPDPCSPHIAADNQKQNVTVRNIPCDEIIGADTVLYEGAGGWFTPINDKETLADWVVLHKLPVILVVGMKLGCLNHAQLTIKAIEQSGSECIGWITNFIDADMPFAQENVDYLIQKLPAPYLGNCPFNQALNLVSEIS